MMDSIRRQLGSFNQETLLALTVLLKELVTVINWSWGSIGFEIGDWKCTRVRSGSEPVLLPTGIWSNSLFCDG